ncbi:hypothetical protein AWV79_32430, partial [Cupriavidus sp. UYMMa02A]
MCATTSKTVNVSALAEAVTEYAVATKSETQSQTAYSVDAFVNWVGCAIGGSRTATVDAAVRAHASMSEGGQHHVLGRTEPLRLADVVLIDCLASAAHAFDDAHPETILHPTGPIAAALLGLARMRKISGKDFITALTIGMEIECRIGVAFMGSGFKRGWMLTGLSGGIGAAAAIGHVLGFDRATMATAVGLAAARASGNQGTIGSMTCAYVPSLAAESGFVAAMLAQAGFTCPIQALSGSTNGLLSLVAGEPAIDRALDGFGAVSEAARNGFKPYPCGIVIHSIIDACLVLVREHSVSANEIEQLEFEISPTTFRLTANKHPRSLTEAQISLFYWAAAVLTTGAAGLAQTADSMMREPSIAALQERITVVVRDDLQDDQCMAVARLAGGRTIEVQIDHAVGSAARPMTSEQIDAKLLAQCAYSSNLG